jgi:ABC-type Mn2+/Zn2+ transport system permease subunit
MLEFLEFAFMKRALMAGVLIGPLCAMLGVFIVLRRMAFFSDAIAHAALTGIALGLILRYNPSVMVVIFSVVVAFIMAYLFETTELASDTVVGVLFSSAVAFGVILLGFVKGYSIDISSILFGDILGVSRADIIIALMLTLIVAAVILSFLKVFVSLTFSPDLVKVEGVNVRFFHYLFILLIAFTVAVGIKIVGVLLVSALIIIPAAAAKNLSRNFKEMLILAVLFGFLSTTTGLVASYYLNTASGPTIVMAGTLIFALSLLRGKTSLTSRSARQ